MTVLLSGVAELREYLSAHVLTCLIPAFFIAGGIAVVVSTGAVLKYFGPRTSKPVSYGVSSVSGVVLAVCSCTILPLFAGIHRKGAGLGPAVTFLYSGPAINLLAIVLTARTLGFELGVGRAVGAIVFSVVIGLIMAFIYRKEEQERSEGWLAMPDDGKNKTIAQMVIFFGLLVAILVVGAWQMATFLKAALIGALLLALVVVLKLWFDRDEIRDWLAETGKLVKLIFPLLLVGVFVAGVLKAVLPPDWIAASVGGNSLQANFIAAFAGALMYFSTLAEVPILKALMDLGMGKGPALALLLAGPALSIPNMLIIRTVMGTQKTIVYVSLVVVMATLTGFIFGLLFP